MIAAAEAAYRSRGVIFIGASLDDERSMRRIPDFIRKYQIEFPVWTGATGETLTKLRMGEAVPATAFLDEQGCIVARVCGVIRKQELDQRIEWLLSNRTGPAPPDFVQHLERN
jgi:hypothetical protein